MGDYLVDAPSVGLGAGEEIAVGCTDLVVGILLSELYLLVAVFVLDSVISRFPVLLLKNLSLCL